MSEFAPPPPKVRVTKKQLREVQSNYQKAQEIAVDLSEKEKKERQKEVEKLEQKLDDVF